MYRKTRWYVFANTQAFWCWIVFTHAKFILVWFYLFGYDANLKNWSININQLAGVVDRFLQYRGEKENDSRGVTLHIALLMKLVDEDGNKVKNQYAHLNLLKALESQIKVKVRLDVRFTEILENTFNNLSQLFMIFDAFYL